MTKKKETILGSKVKSNRSAIEGYLVGIVKDIIMDDVGRSKIYLIEKADGDVVGIHDLSIIQRGGHVLEETFSKDGWNCKFCGLGPSSIKRPCKHGKGPYR